MLVKNSLILKISVILILLGVAVTPVFAQQDDFRLGVNRTFGYSSGDQIRGTFNLYITGSTNIKSVQYLIDGKPIATATSAPFNSSIQTSDFPIGYHDLSATIETTDGRTVTVPARKFEFVSADQESSGVLHIIIPILGIVLAVVLLGFGAQVFLFKNKFAKTPPGTTRNYGLRGGAICPRCHRPYSIHLWALNALTYRLDRCDYCGKWAFIRPVSREALRAAEQNELASFNNNAPIIEKTEEEKLREMLDKSKYSDH